ncbi:MAG: hypothetical protein HFI93_10520 [Lachnospiraceae bacterium]|nr:hypothetical protein [Lachnospiraceae bacterium]
MREKFMRFMQGRYGADSLSRFLMGVAIAAMLLMMFTRLSAFNLIALAAIVLVYFRMLSKNITKRYQENQAYLRCTGRFRFWFGKKKSEFSQRKTHHFYRCPKCRQRVRVPRGKGRIAIRCPKCGQEFIKNS